MRGGSDLGRLEDELGIVAIGPGYLIRRDGHAVGIIELTPPDPRVHDAATLLRIIQEYERAIMALQVRMHWYTIALPPDVRPVVQTLRQVQQQAPDLTSYLVLGALADDLQQMTVQVTERMVRWILAISTEEPETPTDGLLADINPLPPPGHPPKEEVRPLIAGLVQRAVGLLRLFGDQNVRPLSASEIRRLLALMFDPIAWESVGYALEADAARPIQGGGWTPAPAPLHDAPSPTAPSCRAPSVPPWNAPPPAVAGGSA